MINFSTLPSSKAERLDDSVFFREGILFTFHENQDETKIYNVLHARLTVLEASLEINRQELTAIQQIVEKFRVALEEKEEVLLRIDWLHRLYEVKESIQSIDSKDYAEQLRTMILSVQTCPLKNELMTALEALNKSLPSETVEPPESSPEQLLMLKAIEEAGDLFINLGKAGRELVIQDVLRQQGSKVIIEAIQQRATELEERVKGLTAVQEPEELIEQLELLPTSLSTLSGNSKVAVAEYLLKMDKWEGLASLNRMIVVADKAIAKKEQQVEEAKNTILTADGTATLVLDIKYVDNGKVQFL